MSINGIFLGFGFSLVAFTILAQSNLIMRSDCCRLSYNGHHLFYWKKPRDVWLKATAPVFFDFGDDALWHLMTYHEDYAIKAIRRILKSDVVGKHGGNIEAIQSQMGETPIHPQVAPDQIRALWRG